MAMLTTALGDEGRGPLAEAASAVAVPVRSGNRGWGALDVEADRPWAFDALDIEGFGVLAAALAAVLERDVKVATPVVG